jgi:hypothetical protein
MLLPGRRALRPPWLCPSLPPLQAEAQIEKYTRMGFDKLPIWCGGRAVGLGSSVPGCVTAGRRRLRVWVGVA